jgi:hypothetical protein
VNHTYTVEVIAANFHLCPGPAATAADSLKTEISGKIIVIKSIHTNIINPFTKKTSIENFMQWRKDKIFAAKHFCNCISKPGLQYPETKPNMPE